MVASDRDLRSWWVGRREETKDDKRLIPIWVDIGVIYRQQVKQYSPRCLCTPSPTMVVMHVTSRKCPAQPSPNERARAESNQRGRRVSYIQYAGWLSGLCGCGEVGVVRLLAGAGAGVCGALLER